MEKYIDIKLGDCLIKNVPLDAELPFENIIMYMNNHGLAELEYMAWKENERQFYQYKQCVYDIRRATEKLSDMGFNKKTLIDFLEQFYDNYEKGKRLVEEINKLK